MRKAMWSRSRLKVGVLHPDAAVVGELASVELVQILFGKVNRKVNLRALKYICIVFITVGPMKKL